MAIYQTPMGKIKFLCILYHKFVCIYHGHSINMTIQTSQIYFFRAPKNYRIYENNLKFLWKSLSLNLKVLGSL